jgi:hypothetical protein
MENDYPHVKCHVISKISMISEQIASADDIHAKAVAYSNYPIWSWMSFSLKWMMVLSQHTGSGITLFRKIIIIITLFRTDL